MSPNVQPAPTPTPNQKARNMTESITRKDVTTIQNEIGDAVRAIAEAHGLTLTKNNASYTGDSIRFTVAVERPDVALSQAAKDVVGLPAEVERGALFNYGGQQYSLDAIKLNRPKYPISATNTATGKPFKLPQHAVKDLIPQRARLQLLTD